VARIRACVRKRRLPDVTDESQSLTSLVT